MTAVPREKKAFIPPAVSTALGSLAAASSGHEQAVKSKQVLNRLKQKGGVPTQAPTGAPMPAQPDQKTASLMERLEQNNPGQAKEAAAKELGFGVLAALAAGAGTALVSEAIRGGSSALGGVIGNAKRKRMFKNIMQRNPDFKQKEDMAERYFNLIMRFAPSLARDETAVTDYLRRQMQYQTSSIEFVKHLADLEATVRGKIDSQSMSSRISHGAQQSMDAFLGKALAEEYVGGKQKK